MHLVHHIVSLFLTSFASPLAGVTYTMAVSVGHPATEYKLLIDTGPYRRVPSFVFFLFSDCLFRQQQHLDRRRQEVCANIHQHGKLSLLVPRLF